MKQYEKMQAMGKAGEAIICNKYIERGAKPEMSVNQYDHQKDLMIDGKKVEVKTQVPFVAKNAFSIGENQLKKCLEADVIHFVSVPNSRFPHPSEGKVYTVENPKNLQYTYYTTKQGKTMVLFPIEQEAMKEDFLLREDESALLMKYSISGYN
jgi:hypothetical protein